MLGGQPPPTKSWTGSQASGFKRRWRWCWGWSSCWDEDELDVQDVDESMKKYDDWVNNYWYNSPGYLRKAAYQYNDFNRHPNIWYRSSGQQAGSGLIKDVFKTFPRPTGKEKPLHTFSLLCQSNEVCRWWHMLVVKIISLLLSNAWGWVKMQKVAMIGILIEWLRKVYVAVGACRVIQY